MTFSLLFHTSLSRQLKNKTVAEVISKPFFTTKTPRKSSGTVIKMIEKQKSTLESWCLGGKNFLCFAVLKQVLEPIGNFKCPWVYGY
jgi:hypothetical protein